MWKDTLFVFDIDGTLTDSVTTYILSVSQALLTLGIKDIDPDYHNYKHHSDSYALRYNYERNFEKSYPKDLLEQFEKELVARMKTHDPVKEIEGARDLIDYFRAEEIPFCFATGALPEPSHLKLEQAGIWYDDALLATSKISESREGFVKSAIEMAKAYYNASDFKRIISVGDGIWDLQTAQNLSLEFIGIGTKNQETFLKDTPYAFGTIKELQQSLFSRSLTS